MGEAAPGHYDRCVEVEFSALDQGPLGRLSAREVEVLEMISHGLTNRQVAGELAVTVYAIKFHLGSIYRKLSVTNRTEAAVLYSESRHDEARPGG